MTFGNWVWSFSVKTHPHFRIRFLWFSKRLTESKMSNNRHGIENCSICFKEIDHKHTHGKFCINHVYMLIITNMAAMRNFEVISFKCYKIGICTIGNYRQKWITRFYSCCCIIPGNNTVWNDNVWRTTEITNSSQTFLFIYSTVKITKLQ